MWEWCLTSDGCGSRRPSHLFLSLSMSQSGSVLCPSGTATEEAGTPGRAGGVELEVPEEPLPSLPKEGE